ncbi:MAG: acyl-[acyl-carrier-protein] thioesterase [Acidimicrobiales bacterium]|jgi:acyl-ACP thioesterase
MNATTMPDDFAPLPTRGRVYTSERRVRLGDSSPAGRLRFDAMARFLQDVAEDDAEDAHWPAATGWLLRRCAISVAQFPTRTERVELHTFCSATAARWAERTTTIRGDRGGLLQARAIWVAVDVATGRPARLDEVFNQIYGPSADGRKASVRLSLPTPPDDEETPRRPWPIRASDIDVWDHVNNAAHWEAVEEEIARLDWLPTAAELEYNEAIVATDAPEVIRHASPAGVDLWLLDKGRLLASARLHRSAQR